MKEFFKRNRKLLLISLTIFLIFAIGGAIFSFISAGEHYGMISKALFQAKANGTLASNDVPKSTSLGLFLHNIIADFAVIAGGLLFSVISVLIVIFNAVIIGIPFGNDFVYSAVTILPHGIIEYSALIFALAAAFKITQIEIKMIKNRRFRDTLNEHKRELKDILIMIVIVAVLLVIAAVIEANFVEPIMLWYYGI